MTLNALIVLYFIFNPAQRKPNKNKSNKYHLANKEQTNVFIPLYKHMTAFL